MKYVSKNKFRGSMSYVQCDWDNKLKEPYPSIKYPSRGAGKKAQHFKACKGLAEDLISVVFSMHMKQFSYL